MIIAKHHPPHQIELLGLLGGIETKELGFWVVKGWNEVLTEPGAIEQFQGLLKQWASQDDNLVLKKMARQALTQHKRAH